MLFIIIFNKNNTFFRKTKGVPSLKSYIIHFLRHGMTDSNVKGIYTGTTDIPLCEEGKKQLAELLDKYDYGKPDLIFTSPLIRCKQTAHIIFGEDARLNVVDGLHELSMGDFEGKTAEQVIDMPGYTDWVQGKCPPPNGESNKDFATRICTAFVQTVREIMKTGLTESVIVAHGGVIMTLLSVYGISDSPDETGLRWMANNGRGFTIRITPSIWMRTGMFEILSEYPLGSSDEPDLSINPVKKGAFSFVIDEDKQELNFTEDIDDGADENTDYDDLDGE